MINVKLNNFGRTLPLYKRYPGQSQPQRAHIELDEEGTVTAGINGEIGNAVPMDVWHGRTLRWSVSPYAFGPSLEDLINSPRVIELFERVHAGRTVEWDGSNHVGRLDEDAEAAALELEAIFAPDSGEYDLVQACEAYQLVEGSWFNLDELVWAGSVEECAGEIETSVLNEIFIIGDTADAVALRTSEIIERHIDKGTVDAVTLRAAEILAAYDEEFAYLLKACREAAEEE